MKILLINPPFSLYAGVAGHGGSSVPLNLAYIAAYARQKRAGKDKIGIMDCEAERLRYEDIAERIRKHKPDIVGITAPTPAFTQVLKTAEIIKKESPGCKVFVGGPHPSAFPLESAAFPEVDAAVYGEGELTFLALVAATEIKGSYSKIKGIAYRAKSGKVHKNLPRELIADLDELPFPARDLLKMNLYHPPPTKRVGQMKNHVDIIGSRGCPFNCTYCIASTIWTRKYRPRSPKNIVDEIEHCYMKYGLDEFNFHDELFTTIKARTIETCREILRRKLNISWICMSRVDSIDKETLSWMKIAGCRKIVFGFESGSEKILKEMRKNANLEQAYKAARLVKESGIYLGANFIIGHIGETKETIEQTISFAKEICPDTVAFLVACPYPGTDFYYMAKEKGYLRPDFSWKDFVIVTEDTPLINLPGLSADEILKSVKRAYKKFYLRPSYVWYQIRQVKSFPDLVKLLEGARMLLKVS